MYHNQYHLYRRDASISHILQLQQLSSTVATSGDGRPFRQNRQAPRFTEKWEAAVPLSVWELGPHLTQCGLSRGLPPYQVAF